MIGATERLPDTARSHLASGDATLRSLIVETEPTLDIESPLLDASAPAEDSNDLLEDELLVEEISIDGMCGVY